MGVSGAFFPKAGRGLSYEIQGYMRAANVVRDDVYVEPLQFTIDHPDNTQSALSALINTLHQVLPKVTPEKLQGAFASGLPTARIAVGIDPAQSDRLQKLQLPDVFLQPRTWRIYPSRDLAAQILGFVTQYDTDNHGNYGVEGQYDTLLEGKPGSFTAEPDLQGNPRDVGVPDDQPPATPPHLTLTINSTIEYIVQAALADAVKYLQADSGTVGV